MRKLYNTITEEELKCILEATKKQHHKIAFALGFYQCMRVSEVVNLLPENIDKERSIFKSVGNGTRAVVGVVAAGLAIGLGMKAFDTASVN